VRLHLVLGHRVERDARLCPLRAAAARVVVVLAVDQEQVVRRRLALALNWSALERSTCSVGKRPGMVCIRLNWLRFALGSESISLLVMLVRCGFDVDSTSGASAVTTSVSATPATKA